MKKTGILLIEHDMSVVMEISDHVVVLNYGKKYLKEQLKRQKTALSYRGLFRNGRITMLAISKVETFYGNIQALRGVDVKVNSGEIVALIGSNGAGKSTLLMTISGVNKTASGQIIFNEKNIENLPPHDIVNLGISQVPEGRRIFSRLTVEDNLRLGASSNEKAKHYDKDIKDVYDLFPVLKDRLSQRGGTLSGGEQQMLAIGRAMMAKPKMLLLDEPSLGIAPKLVNQIFLAIKNINKEKEVTIFLVEQNAKKALELADRAYVLVNGNINMEGTGKDLLKNKDIQAAYLEGGAPK